MRAENTLRRRLVATFVLLAMVIGGVFAAAAYVIIEALEYELVDVRMSRAAEQFVENDLSGTGHPPLTELHFAIDGQIPESMRALEAGRHEAELDGRVLHVLIVEKGGRRYAVIDDISDFELMENTAFKGLWVAFFAGVLLALAIARASVNRIIAPLTTLSRVVEQGNLQGHQELLAAKDEIGALARAFDARTSQLTDFLVRERLFTADVSHELRTPLTVVLGAAELLTAKLADDPELHTVAERIRRTSADAAMRVSALLQLARSRDRMERGTLGMRVLIEQEIEHCRPLLEGKPVDLTFESPQEVWVHASADLVAIAVGNLLRNACRFTERGRVRVALAVDALVVEDTGPGVPSAVRSRLFERFVRGDDDWSTGSGLGLSIVKRVAEHLGWAIRLDDGPGGGSRFTLSFSPVRAT